MLCEDNECYGNQGSEFVVLLHHVIFELHLIFVGVVGLLLLFLCLLHGHLLAFLELLRSLLLLLAAGKEISKESTALLAFFDLHRFFPQYFHLRSLFALFLHHFMGNSFVQPPILGVELLLLGLVLRSLEVVVEVARPHIVIRG